MCVCIYRCVYICTCEGLLSSWVAAKDLDWDSEDVCACEDSFLYTLHDLG